MTDKNSFDKTNAFIAGIVFLITFVVYSLTVQQSISFWDCGEFIACSYILGIPHPPGTPLLMLIGRILSIIPFVEDISYRVNYLSVISSSVTALFSYLLAVRLIRNFFSAEENSTVKKIITYTGGMVGSLFVAFSLTNWANSVEAEAYGLALALSVAIFWLTMIYHENKGTHYANKIMMVALFLAMLGVGVHMTVFLVVPICAVFFVLKKEAVAKDYLYICGFAIFELLLVMLLSNTNNGVVLFKFLSLVAGAILLVLLYKKIKWGILIAIASFSAVMMSFSLYIYWTLPGGIILLILIGIISKNKKWHVEWKTGLAVIAVAFIGFSTHFYIPIRSGFNPRIDENNPSRDFRTFVNFLDRKQYGQTSMVDRMFQRRGLWENQLGRHPHMGFYSYFEEQYSEGGLTFIPFLLIGFIGMIVAIQKRMEIGIPFFTFFILASLGLVLYMNFADGTQYNTATNDAYLEVRNRDYFFTPAFIFFGIAMGLGISGIIMYLKNAIAKDNVELQKTIAIVCTVLVLLPGISLAKNYHKNDRSNNFIPYQYSKNILDSCPPNAILFTSGDNDTFPVWCLQEVYNYRKDIRVVNLSLLNTDWYVEQMKNRYDVPISLTDEQILWHPFEIAPGEFANRPLKSFYDRPRKRQTYMWPSPHDGRLVKVQDMMVDEIVIENKWKDPICFSSAPYAESPLKLRERVSLTGMVYTLQREPNPPPIDLELSYDLFMNKFNYDGYESSEVYRDENATGVFMGVGVNAVRVIDNLIQKGDTARAMPLIEKMIEVYPEYWQTTITLADILYVRGDTTQAMATFRTVHDTLSSFHESNPENLFYMQDLGLIKTELGRRDNDQDMIDEGIDLLWEAFDLNSNSVYCFRKLITALNQNRRYADMQRAAKQFAEYKINLSDPLLQQLLRQLPTTPQPTP